VIVAVELAVRAIRGEYLEVFRAVVRAHAIAVMHDLVLFEVASQHPLHDETMLLDIAFTVGMRMFRPIEIDVSVLHLALLRNPEAMRSVCRVAARRRAETAPRSLIPRERKVLSTCFAAKLHLWGPFGAASTGAGTEPRLVIPAPVLPSYSALNLCIAAFAAHPRHARLPAVGVATTGIEGRVRC
jgi:hypothetical protein